MKTHVSGASGWAGVVAIIVGGGCAQGVDPKSASARAEAREVCRAELARFPLNVVVLTAHPDAPIPSSLACRPTDWPCVVPSALNRAFRMEGAGGASLPVCADGAGDESCITFVLGASLSRAEVASVSADCDEALWRADAPSGEFADFSAYAAALVRATAACGAPVVRPDMLNLYLYDSTFPGSERFSFAANTRDIVADTPGLDELVMVFIDVERLPVSGSLDFVQGAVEHELGHAFGLDHVCAVDQPTSDASPSNIMQTFAANCCCEAFGPGTPPTSFSTSCVDCSAVAQQFADEGAPDAAWCDDLPSPYDDPDCLVPGLFGVGSRELPFSNDWPANPGDDRGQVTQILARAVDLCAELRVHQQR